LQDRSACHDRGGAKPVGSSIIQELEPATISGFPSRDGWMAGQNLKLKSDYNLH